MPKKYICIYVPEIKVMIENLQLWFEFAADFLWGKSTKCVLTDQNIFSLQKDWINIAAVVFNSISRIFSSSSIKIIAKREKSREFINVEHFDTYS